jgi:hypothetical protein
VLRAILSALEFLLIKIFMFALYQMCYAAGSSTIR